MTISPAIDKRLLVPESECEGLVYEAISKEDWDTIDWAKVKSLVNGSGGVFDRAYWVADRSRQIRLFFACWQQEWGGPPTTLGMFFEGHLISAVVANNSHTSGSDQYWHITSLDIPAHLRARRSEIAATLSRLLASYQYRQPRPASAVYIQISIQIEDDQRAATLQRYYAKFSAHDSRGGFVLEKVSPEQSARVDWATFRCGERGRPIQWIVDHARRAFLVNLTKWGPEPPQLDSWAMGWNGEVIWILGAKSWELERKGGRYESLNVCIPKDVSGAREQILNLVKDAFTARFESGPVYFYIDESEDYDTVSRFYS